MSTPPRLRGLVDRLEKSIRLEYRDRANRQQRKSETALAKVELLRAIALICQPPKEPICEHLPISGPNGSTWCELCAKKLYPP